MHRVTAMETRHLRYFCALAEQLHFTKAAVLLNVAQSALSQQIKQLETELGAKLVDRTKRRIRLTEAGEVFLVRATHILEEIDQAAREAARVGQGDAGSLVIGAVSTAVCSVLPPILRAFRRECPQIKVDIREMEPGEQVDALRRESIDFGMLFLSIPDPTFDSVLVARERLIVALPSGHRAASQDTVRLRDLSEETFLIPRQQGIPGFHELALQTLAENGIPDPRLQPTRMLNTAVFLVAGQLGVALVPESFRQHLRVRGCAYRDLAGAPAYADLLGLWRRDEVPPVLRRFVRQVKQARKESALPRKGSANAFAEEAV